MLSAILGQQFFLECYNPVGEMMDMMVLTNSNTNFILYCLMSSQFKKTLRKMCGVNPKHITPRMNITPQFEVRLTKHFIRSNTYLLKNITRSIYF